ncbi:MAG TPA: FkbM family methyltransferase [Candidatus Limnocylindria bacterium]|nr:FkbM family methyltransferase [Candidatus Limnocylindria bacterium]
MKKIAKFFLGKKWGQSFFKALFLLSIKGMNFGGGSTWSESGEEWVVKYFAKLAGNKEVIFFDVGANVGEYALAVEGILKTYSKNFKILCFEPSKETFTQLKDKTQRHHQLQLFNIALGESAGKLPLYSTKAASGLTSLYNRQGVLGMEASEDAEVETIDGFCKRENISEIDFLKLDVEGNEYKVLLGAKGLLKEKKIKFIQFEFGGTDIDARVYFRDFFNLLNPEYNLYRILKNGLYQIPTYKETEEIFVTTNYLAVLKNYA